METKTLTFPKDELDTLAYALTQYRKQVTGDLSDPTNLLKNFNHRELDRVENILRKVGVTDS